LRNTDQVWKLPIRIAACESILTAVVDCDQDIVGKALVLGHVGMNWVSEQGSFSSQKILIKHSQRLDYFSIDGSAPDKRNTKVEILKPIVFLIWFLLTLP
jgi:hypothetical protein